jgi:hypothetical protein
MTAPEPTAPRTHGWLHPAVVSVAALSMAAGFAQFGATAALGDVARSFGEVTDDGTVAAQVGLSGTVLGIGLSIIRLASLAACRSPAPRTASADAGCCCTPARGGWP